jgi:hypothetical protein
MTAHPPARSARSTLPMPGWPAAHSVAHLYSAHAAHLAPGDGAPTPSMRVRRFDTT